MKLTKGEGHIAELRVSAHQVLLAGVTTATVQASVAVTRRLCGGRVLRSSTEAPKY